MPDTRTARLTVAYDGTNFRGFAESDGVRTVMGELRRAVETVVRCPVELTGAGRTDAGVHGWGQVVSGELPVATDLRRLGRSVNGLCGPDIAVRDVEWTDESFRRGSPRPVAPIAITSGTTRRRIRCWLAPRGTYPGDSTSTR